MSTPPASPPPAEPDHGSDDTRALGPPRPGTAWLWRAGRTAWAALGVLAVIAAVGYATSVLSLVVVPLILALFPATLLWPLARGLGRRRFPSGLAAITSILTGLLLFAAVIGAMVPLVMAEMPALMESAAEGVEELEAWLAEGPFGLEIGGVSDLLAAAQERIADVGDLAPRALGAAATAIETLAGVVLLIVVLFFYLKDGPRLAESVVSLAPPEVRERVRGALSRAWTTLGVYFRWLLVVALVDAVLIGAGLLILRVPLALPLAVLIFFGGLFPIVGAVVTGALAVLVALAHGGPWLALAVLAIVLVVQQIESNVLHPIVQSRAIKIHALVVLLSITAGGILLGILGAFLAVPVAAIAASTFRYFRSEAASTGGAEEAGPAHGGRDDDRPGDGDAP